TAQTRPDRFKPVLTASIRFRPAETSFDQLIALQTG
ncbi:hypothetical protein CP02DC21_2200, partial [Chlamydia psittaci 02DC21]